MITFRRRGLIAHSAGLTALQRRGTYARHKRLCNKRRLCRTKEVLLPNKEALMQDKDALMPDKEALIFDKEALMPDKSAYAIRGVYAGQTGALCQTKRRLCQTKRRLCRTKRRLCPTLSPCGHHASERYASAILSLIFFTTEVFAPFGQVPLGNHTSAKVRFSDLLSDFLYYRSVGTFWSSPSWEPHFSKGTLQRFIF